MKTVNPLIIPFKAIGEFEIALEEVVVLKESKTPKLLAIIKKARKKKIAT